MTKEEKEKLLNISNRKKRKRLHRLIKVPFIARMKGIKQVQDYHDVTCAVCGMASSYRIYTNRKDIYLCFEHGQDRLHAEVYDMCIEFMMLSDALGLEDDVKDDVKKENDDEEK